MIYLLYTVHVLLCLFLILVVLLQQGKGADLSVFGGGSTMTAFGARSATTLLHRLTVGAFVGFVLTTLSIAYMQAHVEGASVLRGAAARPAAQQPAAPAAGESAPAAAGAPAESAPTPPPAAGETAPPAN
ncbi:MAG TPA: preprotein translocase subunit SecG [Thermoanaerobaculia bacterium]|nr:preprotein translocase subunit SecG [Thermoanaerobaculia bacterium]